LRGQSPRLNADNQAVGLLLQAARVPPTVSAQAARGEDVAALGRPKQDQVSRRSM
jgi:hypothetical protein